MIYDNLVKNNNNIREVQNVLHVNFVKGAFVEIKGSKSAEYFVKFTNDYPDFKKWLTQKKFTLWLENFGKFYKIETEQGRSHSVRWIYYKTNKQTIFEDESPF